MIVDISNPSSSTVAGSYDTAGWAVHVAISGKHAYVTDDRVVFFCRYSQIHLHRTLKTL
jgi:hypothetical protein